MPDEFLPLSDRAEYYRALAASMRARIPSLQSEEARNELGALAADYERLATYLESKLESDKNGADQDFSPSHLVA